MKPPLIFISVATYFRDIWDDSLKKNAPWEKYEWLGMTFGNVSLGLVKSHTINIESNKTIGLPIATGCKINKKFTTLVLFFAFFRPFIFVTRLCRSNTEILLWISPLLELYREINSDINWSEIGTIPSLHKIYLLLGCNWCYCSIGYEPRQSSSNQGH